MDCTGDHQDIRLDREHNEMELSKPIDPKLPWGNIDGKQNNHEIKSLLGQKSHRLFVSKV